MSLLDQIQGTLTGDEDEEDPQRPSKARDWFRQKYGQEPPKELMDLVAAESLRKAQAPKIATPQVGEPAGGQSRPRPQHGGAGQGGLIDRIKGAVTPHGASGEWPPEVDLAAQLKAPIGEGVHLVGGQVVGAPAPIQHMQGPPGQPHGASGEWPPKPPAVPPVVPDVTAVGRGTETTPSKSQMRRLGEEVRAAEQARAPTLHGTPEAADAYRKAANAAILKESIDAAKPVIPGVPVEQGLRTIARSFGLPVAPNQEETALEEAGKPGMLPTIQEQGKPAATPAIVSALGLTPVGPSAAPERLGIAHPTSPVYRPGLAEQLPSLAAAAVPFAVYGGAEKALAEGAEALAGKLPGPLGEAATNAIQGAKGAMEVPAVAGPRVPFSVAPGTAFKEEAQQIVAGLPQRLGKSFTQGQAAGFAINYEDARSRGMSSRDAAEQAVSGIPGMVPFSLTAELGGPVLSGAGRMAGGAAKMAAEQIGENVARGTELQVGDVPRSTPLLAQIKEQIAPSKATEFVKKAAPVAVPTAAAIAANQTQDENKKKLLGLAALGTMVPGEGMREEPRPTEEVAKQGEPVFPPKIQTQLLRGLDQWYAENKRAPSTMQARYWPRLVTDAAADAGTTVPVEHSRMLQQVFGEGKEPVSVEEARQRIQGLGELPALSKGLYSRLARVVETLPGKRWDEPVPAADWIGKLRGNKDVSSAEYQTIEPALQDAQAAKQKLSRSDVQDLVTRYAPQIKRHVLGGAEESDEESEIQPVENVRHENTEHQINLRKQAINDDNLRIEFSKQQRAEDAENDAKNAESRRRELQQEAGGLIESGTDRDRLNFASLLAKKVEDEVDAETGRTGEYGFPYRAVDRILDSPEVKSVLEKAVVPIDQIEQRLREKGYKITESPSTVRRVRTSWKGGAIDEPTVYYDTLSGADRATDEEIRARVTLRHGEEAGRNAEVYEAPTGPAFASIEVPMPDGGTVALDADLTQGWSKQDALKQLKAWNNSYAHLIKDDNPTLKITPPRLQMLTHIERDDGKFSRSDFDRNELLRDAALHAGLSGGGRTIERVREDLANKIQAYGHAHSVAMESESDLLQGMEAPEEEWPEEHERIQRHTQEIEQLQQRYEAEKARRPAAGMSVASDPWAKRIEVKPSQSAKYKGLQTIGGGKDYHEYLIQWTNPGKGQGYERGGHFGPDVENTVSHFRTETHRLYTKGMEDVSDLDHIVARPDDSNLIRASKAEMQNARKAIQKIMGPETVTDSPELREKPIDELTVNELLKLAEFETPNTNEMSVKEAANNDRRREQLQDQYISLLRDIHVEGRKIAQEYQDIERRRLKDNPESMEWVDTLINVEDQSDYGQRAIAHGVQSPEVTKQIADLTARHMTANRRWIDIQSETDDARGKWNDIVRRFGTGLRLPSAVDIGANDDASVYRKAFDAMHEKAPEAEALYQAIKEGRVRESMAADEVRQIAGKIQTLRGTASRDAVHPSPFFTGTGAAKMGAEGKPRQVWDIGENEFHRSHNIDVGSLSKLNSAAFLDLAAELGFTHIGWSNGQNRNVHAQLRLPAAEHIYDRQKPSDIKALLNVVGYQGARPEGVHIGGWGHWHMEIPPEVLRRIRQNGLPIMGWLGLAAALNLADPDKAEAEGAGSVSPKRPKGQTAVAKWLEGGGLTAAVAAGALLFARKKGWIGSEDVEGIDLGARLPATVETPETSPPPELRSALQTAKSFLRPEPKGTPYSAPIDVKETPSGKGPAQFNVEKIGLSEEAEPLWRQAVEDLALKKEHVTHAQTKAEAEIRSLDLDALMQKPRWTGTDALAGRMLQASYGQHLVSLDKQLTELQGKIAGGTADAGATDQAQQLAMRFAKATADLAEINSRTEKERAAAGRNLNAYKIVAKATLDPGVWSLMAQRSKQSKLTELEQQHLLGLLNNKDRRELVGFVNGLRHSTLAERLSEGIRLGMLASLTTSEKVAVSHALSMAHTMIDHPIAVAMDYIMASGAGIFGKLRGKDVKPLAMRRTMALAVKGDLSARVRGAKAGFKEAAQTFKTGATESEAQRFNTSSTPGRVNFDTPLMQAVQRTIYAAHALGYAPFQHAQIEAVVNELTLVDARRMHAENPSKSVAEHRAELLHNPTPEIIARAVQEANRLVFQDKTLLGEVARAAKRETEKNPVTRVGATFVMPFTTIPANIATRAVDATPLGVITAAVRQLGGPFDQRRLAQDLTRSLTGTGLMWLGYVLAHKALATGLMPSQPGEKDRWLAEKRQPLSIRFGDHWVNIAELGPQGMLMTLGAEWYRAVHEDPTLTQKVSHEAGAIGKTVTETPFLQGLMEAYKTISDPQHYGDQYVKSIAQAFVPSGVRRLAHATDPLVRETSSAGEQVESAIPGLSHRLPAKRDVFGNPITRTTGERVAQMVSPSTIQYAPHDKVMDELERLNIGVPGSRASVIEGGKARPSTPAEKRTENTNLGPVRHQAWESVINDPRYAKWPDDIKKEVLERTRELPTQATSWVADQLDRDQPGRAQRTAPADLIAQKVHYDLYKDDGIMNKGDASSQLRLQFGRRRRATPIVTPPGTRP